MKKKINLIITALLIIYAAALKAQTGPVTLSSPNTTGAHNSNISVTMSPVFSTSAPFSAAIVPVDCYALSTTPTINANYIITSVPRVSGFTDESMLPGQGTCQLMQTIQYVDGLGRPIQTVQVMASPFLYDMVQPQAYDQFGRELNKYLPYTPFSGVAGSYRSAAISSEQQGFYTSPPGGSAVSRIDSAHARTLFDNSPLNRPVEQGATGLDWQIVGTAGAGHTVKMDYKSNNDTVFAGTGIDTVRSRQVALYTTSISSAGVQTLLRTSNTATYTAGTVTVTIAKDENWTSGRSGTVEEYKDVDGKVILKRVYNYAGSLRQQLSTYYVYDDLGRLAFVLPPGAKPDSTAAISSTTLNDFCYQYRYDGLGRSIQKKLPGKGWEYMVYNNMDQVVATQDSLQHFNKQWIYSKYDAQGRVITTGIWTNGGTDITRTNLQARLDTVTVNFFEAPLTTGTGYTNVAWPTSSTTALTWNYYDNYNNAPGKPSRFTAPANTDLATRGQLVATKIAVLNTPANMLWTTHYYDYWGRSLKGYSQHYLGGVVNTDNFDAISATYDFTNAPGTTTRKHWIRTDTTKALVTITNTYLYDHMGRKLKTWEQIQNGTSTPTTKTLISKIDYNEIGQVKTKNLHSTDSLNFLQPVRYTYNQRGWLLSSTAALFEMKLQYNTGANKQYNGNIMYQQWGTRLRPDSNTFTYAYDKLNRLTSGASLDNFKERGITYDVMGNITGLNRYQAGTLIDSLAYTYSGNRATGIADRTSVNTGLVYGTTNYVFDGNGNLRTSTNSTNAGQNKRIGYNLLNLPYADTTATGIITYTYDAGGQKLRKVSVVGATTTTTEYIEGIQYLNRTDSLDFIQTEEGRAARNGAGYDYQYYLGDNLGNTRVTFGTKTGTAIAYQRDDYYPFGLEISRTPPVPNPKNEYLYNKKELQEELGQYDYGARFYDPVIARWGVVDPMAEVSRRWSPYNYVLNNPIRMIDPDGMSAEDYQQLYNSNAGINSDGSKQSNNNDKGEPCCVAKADHAAQKKPKIRPLKNFSTLSYEERTRIEKLTYKWGKDAEKAIRLEEEKCIPPNMLPRVPRASGAVTQLFPENFIIAVGLTFATDGVSQVAEAGGSEAIGGEAISTTDKIFGHTFERHGEDATNFITKRAAGSGLESGQFLDDQAAAKFIKDNLGSIQNTGPINLPMPSGFPARIINPDGTFGLPTHIRLIPSGAGVKTAYPIIIK